MPNILPSVPGKRVVPNSLKYEISIIVHYSVRG